MVSNNDFKETGLGPIPEDWDLKRLEDIAEVNERNINKVFNSDLIRYIDVSSVHNGIIKEIKEVKLEEAPSRAKRIVRNNDILISTVRPNLKHFAYVTEIKPNTVASTGFAVISAKKVSPNFLYYYLTTDNYTKYLISIADSHTSTYPAFNPDVIEKSFVPYPSLSEQNSIAQILSDLDSKIELNQRMNQTLEKIGMAIFRHWFVDFEFPDEQGRPYKSSGGEMVDSELGKIPKGWEIKSLGSICKMTMGQSPKSEFYNEEKEGLPFHQGVTDFNERFPTHRMYCTVEKKIAENKDILLSVRAPVGRINVANTKIVIGRGLCAIKHKKCLQSFLFYLLKHIFSEEDSIGSGTVFNAVNKKELNDLKVLAPKGLDKQFNELIKPLDKKIEFLNAESNNLSQIRDLLLPKFMSGKIRVLSEEKMVKHEERGETITGKVD